MSDLIKAIIKTRKLTADIFVKALVDLENNSEIEIAQKILIEVGKHKEIFPEGWYNPPPSGVAVLLDEKPFKRLQFKTIRDSEYWPKNISYFEKKSVGIIYFSSVDQSTNMIGDIGFTLYKGEDDEIKRHIEVCYKAILSVAKHAEVGMSFSELCEFGKELFKDKFKITKWISLSSGILEKGSMNLGHTIPGVFEADFNFGNNFEEIRETIRTKRIFINSNEEFKIPETCAFTLEARLADEKKEYLPNTFFHFIVCFDEGKKIILENFDEIFRTVGMDYMNIK